MKKNYEQPEAELLMFKIEDIMTESESGGRENELPEVPHP